MSNTPTLYSLAGTILGSLFGYYLAVYLWNFGLIL